jgi:hypothetical protein
MLSTAEGEANGTSVLYFFVSDIELVASTMSPTGSDVRQHSAYGRQDAGP